jgi:hypothetical protein
MNAPSALFIAAFGLSFYVLGATFIDAFVNYRTWPLIGAAELKAYPAVVVAFVAIPITLMVASTASLLWWHPAAIPLWSIESSLALSLFAIAISIAFQIRIQRELDRVGQSRLLLQRVTSIEGVRNAAHIANSVLFLWMGTKL